MKILFTLKPLNGSNGGGCFFVKNLVNYLIKKRFEIVYTLQKGIDLIFIIDPRKNRTNNFHIDEIIDYKKQNPSVKIIHRVNECDIKRDKSINIDPKLIKTMQIADHVIFISKWLQNYFIKKYKVKIKNYSCILNGCNSNYFFPNKNINLNKNKIKIITHHWSNNYLKGFEIYNKLDEILPRNKNIEFTFVGRYNKKYKPKNIKLISPKSDMELANIIRKHDIYLTATQNEPCGMHHLEGLSCGLPILYFKGGGAIKEACDGVGEEFQNIDDFLIKLKLLVDNYEIYRNKIDYNFLSSNRCSKEYIEIIEKI